jgi:succinylglutamic semialdehyde dehydrogenase
MESRGLFINGKWQQGTGAVFLRNDPTEGKVTWQGASASLAEVDAAAQAAASAAPAWARLKADARAKFLDAFANVVNTRREDLLNAICFETGKPRWEAKTEVDAVKRKVALTHQAFAERRNTSATTANGLTSATRYRPLGAVAVLGPFNLPAHLPNGQIAPALLAGNTVVFKPSELAPRVGEIYAECWEAAQLPAGVFNLIQGGQEQGAAIVKHPAITGIFFTGSHSGGVALSIAVAPYPQKLLALELGGNNPLVVENVANMDAAVNTIAQSAFITAGQRCTCARRLILPIGDEGDRILARLVDVAKEIQVGPHTLSPEPFMGPVITESAAQRLLNAQANFVNNGAVPLLRMRSQGTRINMLTPAVLDVTAIKKRPDEEYFGPLLQVIRVKDFDAAIAEANNTRFGLAAALLSDDAALYERFSREVNAGIVNWNRPTTGAASDLPFGGVGASGNHRPAGFFAVDFCSDPVASLESPTLELPKMPLPGLPQ